MRRRRRALDLPGQLLDRARRLGSTLSGHGDRRGLRVDPEPPCRPRSKFCAPRPNDRRPARLKMGPPRSPARSPHGRTQRRRLPAIHRSAVRPGAQRAAVIRRGHARRHRPAQPFREHGVPDRGPARRIQGRDADSPSELPDAQRHPDRAGLDARAERGRHRHATSLARAGRHGAAARHARAGGHALCSAVPLDRRRFSRSGQAGRLAAPPGLAQRPHARAVARLAASRPFRAHGLGPRRHGGPGRALGTVGTRAGPDAGTARDPAPHRAIAGSTARCLRHGAGALRPDPCRPAQRQSAGGWRAHPCYRFR